MYVYIIYIKEYPSIKYKDMLLSNYTFFSYIFQKSKMDIDITCGCICCMLALLERIH